MQLRNTATADYIPGRDANFHAWQSNFVTYANVNPAAPGLVAADMTQCRRPSPVTSCLTYTNRQSRRDDQNVATGEATLP